MSDREELAIKNVFVQTVSPEKETKDIQFPWQYGLSQASSSIPYECLRLDFSSSKETSSRYYRLNIFLYKIHLFIYFSPQISISQLLTCSWLIMLICVNISAVMMHCFSAKNKTWANKITSRFNRSTKQQVLFKQYICYPYKW